MSNLRERGGIGYRRFEASPTPTHPSVNNELSLSRDTTITPDSAGGAGGGWGNVPWPWTVGHRPESSQYQSSSSRLQSPTGSEWHRLQIQDPDRLFLSVNVSTPAGVQDDENATVTMPPPLPNWVWTVLTHILGIGTNRSRKKVFIATFLHILTLVAAFLFGVCGLFFNVYDTLSEFTKTTVLVCIAKSVLGLYWMGLGSYANSLAARLFSNQRMVECIRFHSKTFLKISTALIVSILTMVVIGTNFYSNIYLLEEHHAGNGTIVKDANCVTAGVNVVLCKIYFASKIFYSCLCLMWNLLVVGIYLSVCRTHTISIRRFMKELMYDTKIYEEFLKIQALEEQVQNQSLEESRPIPTGENYVMIPESHIWDDDISCFEFETDGDRETSSNAQLLQRLRLMRQTTRERLTSEMASSLQSQDWAGREQAASYDQNDEDEAENEDGRELSTSVRNSEVQDETLEKSAHFSLGDQEEEGGEEEKELQSSLVHKKPPLLDSRLSSKSFMINGRPPIIKNEDLMFTYFTLQRRLSSTSRVLQRWISSWITFVMLWCALLIVYWTSHTAELSGIVQFLLPLVALGLLTSAYAEVNFEGERLPKCILPTDERLAVLHYIQDSRLELKIFSFTMSYNTIVTVVAGIAVTFATRIILDQFNLG